MTQPLPEIRESDLDKLLAAAEKARSYLFTVRQEDSIIALGFQSNPKMSEYIAGLEEARSAIRDALDDVMASAMDMLKEIDSAIGKENNDQRQNRDR